MRSSSKPSPNPATVDMEPDAASIAQAIQAAQAAQNQIAPILQGNAGVTLPGVVPGSGPSVSPGRIPTDPTTAAVMSQIGISANATGTGPADDNGVYVPQVRGPNDPAPAAAVAPTAPSAPAGDPADLRQGGGDGAFVF